MFTVYVLYSEKYDKIYIGYSSDFEDRLRSHNEYATKGYSLKFRPWKVVYTENYTTKGEAMKREKQLKTSRGRAFIRNVISEKYK